MTIAGIERRISKLENHKHGKPKRFTLIGGGSYDDKGQMWRVKQDEAKTHYPTIEAAFNHLNERYTITELKIIDYPLNIARMSREELQLIVNCLGSEDEEQKHSEVVEKATEKATQPSKEFTSFKAMHPDLNIKHVYEDDSD